MMRILVTGAGGFIGSHLVRALKEAGHWVRGVDTKKPEWSPTAADEFHLFDLRIPANAVLSTKNIDCVFALAADMGGMGHISSPLYQAVVMYNNTMINFNTLEAARREGVSRYLFTSSVCVYPVHRLAIAHIAPLCEEDVYPAIPQHSYGWEKLQAEHLCRYYRGSYGVETRIARLQNCYGPEGAWTGGREKAPAALARKIAVAKLTNNPEVEIWGDGQATRSFMYIEDCVRGLLMLMDSDCHDPVTLGPDHVISVDDLVDILADAAGFEVVKKHVEGPEGVRGRNFDHARARALGWKPLVSLEEGLSEMYHWVEARVRETQFSEKRELYQ